MSADDLLRPREAAALLGVGTATLARWVRDGRLTPVCTPGGHRRYPRSAVTAVTAARDGGEHGEAWVAEAVRLYEQGWSIRRVADRFGCGYGVMHRVLRRHVAFRPRGGRPRPGRAGEGLPDGRGAPT